MTAATTRATTPAVAPVFSFPFLLNPTPTLNWLRENDPVHRIGAGALVLLTRHEDAVAALAAPGLSAEQGQADRSAASGLPTSMLNTDGAEHARLRKPGGVLLGPRAVEAALPRFEHAVREILDGLGEQADLVREIGEPVATAALAAILGIEPSDVPAFDRHAREVAVALDPVPSPQVAAAARESSTQFHGFVDELLDRAAPDSPLGRLGSHDITRLDVVGLVSLATIGGWGPLADVTAVALHRWIQEDRARTGPDGTEPAAWCEELTRWHTPIPFVARKALSDVDLPSGRVEAGAQVLIHLGAADHDPGIFPDPDRIAPGRPGHSLAFGSGSHLCLGAPLVRAVLPHIVGAFTARYPQARLRGTRLMWQPVLFPRRPVSTVVDLT